MRLRLVLPLLSVVLAAVLFRVGDMQTDKIWNARCQSGFVEPVPDSYARARYLDYAFNAPAWATLGAHRGMLGVRSTYWTGRDLRYFMALILMWYFLGSRIDEQLGNKELHDASPRTWWDRTLALTCMCYGLFLCYRMLPEIVPVRGYGHWVPNCKYEPWFVAAVIIWGLGLASTGTYSLLRRKQ